MPKSRVSRHVTLSIRCLDACTFSHAEAPDVGWLPSSGSLASDPSGVSREIVIAASRPTPPPAGSYRVEGASGKMTWSIGRRRWTMAWS